MTKLEEILVVHLLVVGRFLMNEGHTRAGLFYLAGYWFESRGRLGRAVVAYQRAIKLADVSPNRRVFKIRQKWQFALERSHHAGGNARVEDPLFECAATPNPETLRSAKDRSGAVGHYRVEWGFRGLSIIGFLSGTGDRRGVRVSIDGILMREISVSRKRLLPPYFSLRLSRAAIGALCAISALRVESEDGQILLCEGCEEVVLSVPHGSGRLVRNAKAPVLDKKGFLVSEEGTLDVRLKACLEIYRKASKAFESEFGLSLMLLYGTLLGQHRDGDFIPGDDDFDVGYVSSETSPEAVKKEAIRIVMRLVAEGFTVSFNRNGRLFRLRLASCQPDTHLDVHVIWFERNMAWVHPQACLACGRTEFLPARQAALRGVTVKIPQRPEAFLRAYYGNGWVAPDPAYSTAAKGVPNKVKRHLARACVTPAEHADMQRELVDLKRTKPSVGRLISIGSFSLYPLEEYEANCDW